MSNETEEKSSKSSSISGAFVLFILNIVIIKSGSLEQFERIGLGERWKFHEYMMWASVAIVISLLVTIWLGCVTVISENDGCASIFGLVSTLCMIGLLAAFVIQYVYMGKLWDHDPEHTIFFYGAYWNEGVTDMSLANLPSNPSTGNTTLHTLGRSLQAMDNTSYTNTPIEFGDMSKAALIISMNLTKNVSLGNLRGAIRPMSLSKLLSNKANISTLLERRLRILTTRRLAESELAPKWVYVMSDVVIRIYGFCLMILPVLLAIVACCGGTAMVAGKAAS